MKAGRRPGNRGVMWKCTKPSLLLLILLNKPRSTREHAVGSVLMPLHSVKESLNEVTFHLIEFGLHETNHKLKRHLNMQSLSGWVFSVFERDWRDWVKLHLSKTAEAHINSSKQFCSSVNSWDVSPWFIFSAVKICPLIIQLFLIQSRSIRSRSLPARLVTAGNTIRTIRWWQSQDCTLKWLLVCLDTFHYMTWHIITLSLQAALTDWILYSQGKDELWRP